MNVNTDLRDRWSERARQRIAEAGLRAGPARMMVMDLLASHGQCLIGPQDIVDRLRASGSPGSQASVYRVLDEFHSLGLVRRSLDDQGQALYEIDDHHHHHHHLVDVDSGAIEAFEDPALEAAIHQAADRLGIDLVEHEIVLKGRRRSGAG